MMVTTISNDVSRTSSEASRHSRGVSSYQARNGAAGSASWSRVEAHGLALDVLEVNAARTRSWCFVWPGRVVIQARSAGIDFTDGDRTEALPAGAVLLIEAFGARTKITSAAGASFRVLFEIPRNEERAGSRSRLHAPRLGGVLPLDAPEAELFRSATAASPEQVPCIARVVGPVAHARAYIEENLHDEFDLETLSDAAGVDRCHLCRMFQRTLGLPPYRFRTHLRVARARQLLASGVDCIATAYTVGFCDQSHFTRWFKELTGTTPGAYAKACRAPRDAWHSATEAA